jgi:hypothetical protein
VKIKTWIEWWLGDRYRWKRRCASLHIANKELRVELENLRQKLYVSNRDRIEAEGRLKQAQEMWVHEGSQWRDQINSVLVWLGRVATGFGPGDDIPKRELVEADTVSHSKLSPQDSLREILRRAAQNNG